MVWFGSERKGRLGTGEWGLEAGGWRLEAGGHSFMVINEPTRSILYTGGICGC